MESGFGLEEKTGGQRIAVLDEVNEFDSKKSDSFVTIDMESFSHGINKDLSSNSRITWKKLQRSFSRKGSQSGNEKKISHDATGNERMSPSANSLLKGSSTPEKAATVLSSVRATDQTVGITPQVHHQITITTSNSTTPTESRVTVRKNSLKRCSYTRILDPKKVLLFLATLSSIGSILLIILTLSVSNRNADDISLD